MSAVVVLDGITRAAVVRELLRYARARQGVMPCDCSERLAELASDPTFAYASEDVWQAEVERETRAIQRLQERLSEEASPWLALGAEVDRSGQISLADAGATRLLAEALAHTGWDLEDPHAQPPADIRPVLEALADARAVIPAE